MVLPVWSRRWLPYVIAAGGVAAATAFRYALNPILGSRIPNAIYYFALIPIASRLGGGPALLALALSTAASVVCFVEPYRGWGVSAGVEMIGVGLFVLINLILIGYAEDNRASRRRLEREVADRIGAEAALRAAKHAAEDASRAKDRFMAVLSHELRTPLNPVALTVRALLGRPDQPDDVRRDLEAIGHYVDLEVRLIDDLLDAVRIGRGELALHWEVVDLHRLVSEAGRAAQAEMASLGLRLEVSLNARRHHVQADPNRLRQVLANLLRNAAKFTPRGGSVALRTLDATAPARAAGGRRVVSFDHAADPLPEDNAPAGLVDQIVVEVADSGIGMEPAELARVFEPFSQADPAIRRRFGGLGLGLSICVGIVEGHGGSLQARSDGRNRGTTVAVRLPVAPEPASTGEVAALGSDPVPADPIPPTPATSAALTLPDPIAPDPASDLAPGRLRVLVVEDEPATIRVMTRLLRNLGHRVSTATDLAAGVACIDGPARLDLLISDIGLPDGSGLDLMRHARANRPDLPAIALTGFGTEADIEQSRLAGFTAHMTKPIDFDQLTLLIDRVANDRVIAAR